MFSNLPILSFITFIPAFVAVLLMVFSRLTAETGRAQLEKNASWVALVTTIFVLLLSVLLLLD